MRRSDGCAAFSYAVSTFFHPSEGWDMRSSISKLLHRWFRLYHYGGQSDQTASFSGKHRLFVGCRHHFGWRYPLPGYGWRDLWNDRKLYFCHRGGAKNRPKTEIGPFTETEESVYITLAVQEAARNPTRSANSAAGMVYRVFRIPAAPK